MSARAAARYLRSPRGAFFTMFHVPPEGARQRAPVLFVPPWGWDDVASARSRRRWAIRLAASGRPVARITLPGVGNSPGGPGDSGRVEAWLAAIESASTELRAASLAPGLVLVGFGLGGLLGLEAAARGAEVDSLVTWAAPASGRAWVRETRAFSRLQPWGAGGEGDGLAPGWIEAGGFLLSAETIEEIGRLEPRASAGGSLSRALLLSRGENRDPAGGASAALSEAGVAVESAPGPGWGLFVSHPERSRMADAVADRVEEWLGAAPPGQAPESSSPAPFPPGGSELKLELGGGAVTETPLFLEAERGAVFGVLTEPDRASGGLAAVLLNAGAVSNVGPNRMWVETARRWAAMGVASLRIDLEAIGEADGEEELLTDVDEFYTEGYERQVIATLDALQQRGVADRFLLVGLCAGGYYAFRASLADSRVEAAVLLNAGALAWHSGLIAERGARKVSYLRSWRCWRRLLTGQVDGRRVGSFLRSLPRGLARRLGRGRPFASGYDADFDRLRDRHVRLLVAFSGREPLAAELAAVDVAGRIGRWPNMSLVDLPGDDHTLRPPRAQLAARALLDRELSALLSGVGRAQE